LEAYRPDKSLRPCLFNCKWVCVDIPAFRWTVVERDERNIYIKKDSRMRSDNSKSVVITSAWKDRAHLDLNQKASWRRQRLTEPWGWGRASLCVLRNNLTQNFVNRKLKKKLLYFNCYMKSDH
jgi:hypothetical protein